jgi:hypothetical protein
MKCDLDNLIETAANMLEGRGGYGPGYAFTIREIRKHLHEAVDGYLLGDTKPLDEFIVLYCLEKKL